jgi:hypothetical protein
LFLYAQSPSIKRAKQNTIGVITGANVKLAHHKGHVPTYQMKNEMSLVHHIIK